MGKRKQKEEQKGEHRKIMNTKKRRRNNTGKTEKHEKSTGKTRKKENIQKQNTYLKQKGGKKQQHARRPRRTPRPWTRRAGPRACGPRGAEEEKRHISKEKVVFAKTDLSKRFS